MTELVVFVTPSVVDAQTPGLADRVDQTRGRLERTYGPPPYLTDPLQPHRDPGQPQAPLPGLPGAPASRRNAHSPSSDRVGASVCSHDRAGLRRPVPGPVSAR